MPAPDSYAEPCPAPRGAPEEVRPDGLVGSLCGQLPEFVPAYLALADACGDDPGDHLVLMELADFVSVRMAAARRDRSALERALAAVEAHLDSNADDDVGSELIAFAFFDMFSPDERGLLAPLLGPRSRMVTDALDLPGSE